MLAVIDTNILVSAMLSERGTPAKIVALASKGVITPCYDNRILREYRDVLTRPKFKFDAERITELLDMIIEKGENVKPDPLDIEFTDKDDKKFYEAAKFCNAELITENIRHFPADKAVMTVSEFLEKYNL